MVKIYEMMQFSDVYMKVIFGSNVSNFDDTLRF